MNENGDETAQELHFFYDAQSKPVFVEFEGEKYRYVHSLQGDIIGIVDDSGMLVVEYKYDAWGKLISTTGFMADTMGKANPFCYRGYVWDEETRLYYLRSRYFSPRFCRFISSDALLSDALTGKNAYLYCANMPVISCDEDGCVYYLAILNHLFHQEVQKAIVDTYCPESGIMEQPISNLPKVSWRSTTNGRLDVYDTKTHCFWEVKKATLSSATGFLQVERYMNGSVQGVTPIPGGWVEGRTTFKFGNLNFGILYYSVGPGLVVYEVTDLSTMQFVPVPSAKAIQNLTENQNAARKYQKLNGLAPDFSRVAGGVRSVISAGAIFLLVLGLTRDISMAWNTAIQKLGFA